MPDPTPDTLEAALRRLKKERDAADVRYNEALTAVDRALRPLDDLPAPAGGFDHHQIAALNDAWDLDLVAPPAGGVKGRLAGFVWRLVAPFLERQLTFNSRLVDHVNRQAAAATEAHRVADATTAALRDRLATLHEFQRCLMVLLQQVTAYVDTRDRDAAGGALVLNASLSGVAETMAKRWESLATREQRAAARAAAMSASHEELRMMVAVSQDALMSLRRELQRTHEVQGVQEVHGVHGVHGVQGFGSALDSYKYVGFEDQFRGSREVIRQRLESYLPAFDGATDVLDVGCGRGEFLDLLQAHGIAARGIDLNHEMVEGCRARGLDVSEADAVSYLTSVPDASLGGVFAAQVVEHLQPGYLLQFLDLSFHKLRPGGRLVLETLNPACWVAFFESYIRDITHVWPLHPDTLRFFVVASGFTKTVIEFRSPVPEQDRLQAVAVPAGADPVLADLAEAVNGNVEKLNNRLFTHMDYAVVADR